MKMRFEIQNISEIHQVIKQIFETFPELKHILFYGEMGSGKTTFISAVCKFLGSTDEISSPTFSIVNEYRLEREKIFHFDLYRIKNIQELQNIGFEEYLSENAYLFIEWPQVAEELIKGEQFSIVEFFLSENINRIIEFTYTKHF